MQEAADGTVRVRPDSHNSGDDGVGGGGEAPHFRTVTAADMAAFADESDVPLIAAAKGAPPPQQPPLRPPSLRAVRAAATHCDYACHGRVHNGLHVLCGGGPRTPLPDRRRYPAAVRGCGVASHHFMTLVILCESESVWLLIL